MPGNMDPLGQVAQILGVHRATSLRTQESASVEPHPPKKGGASLVHVSHSGAALASMADRLRAVGFVHDPSGAGHQEYRPPADPAMIASQKESDNQPDVDDKSSSARLREFAETDEHRAKRKEHNQKLNQEELDEVQRLKDLDSRVKAHEMAHKVAAGSLAAGGPYYEFEQGPDGVNYAVAGHVPIHVPETNDAEQALRDSEKARRAALAPADPSSADRAAAAQFSARAAEARQQIARERGEKEARQLEEKTAAVDSAQAQSGNDIAVQENESDEKAIHAHRHPEFLLGTNLPK